MNSFNRYTVIVVIALGLTGGAQAHQPWVLAEQARIAPDQSARIAVYFDHAFPGGDLMDVERIARATLMTPADEIGTLDPGGTVPFASPALALAGTYVVGIEQVRSFWTRTPEGGRPLPGSELEDALHCKYSGNAAKTLVSVGAGDASDQHEHSIEGSAAVQPLGHRLEILPRVDPTRIGAGQMLPVRVLFEGKAHAGPLTVFYAESGEDSYLLTETDDRGAPRGRVVGPGPVDAGRQRRVALSGPRRLRCGGLLRQPDLFNDNYFGPDKVIDVRHPAAFD